MDASIQRSIERIRDWKELAQFEVNARERHRLDAEVQVALRDHSIRLGRQLIERRAGIDLAALNAAETKIVEAVARYVAIKKSEGSDATYTLRQIENHGLIGAVEKAVARATTAQGFQSLAEADLAEVSYEQVVIDHPDEFSPRALWFALRRLGQPTEMTTPPASGNDATQRRTQMLIGWLKAAAHANGLHVPVYRNTEAAAAMAMQDTQRFGRVHGNIQSRIDYACFLLGIPPLGLTMDAPFADAWAQQGREWAYPVEAMKVAARERLWTDDDFNSVLRETERMPGLAYPLWRMALAEREAAVRAWANSFLDGGDPLPHAYVPGPKRNPAWSRDELILALDLYMRQRAAPLGKGADEIADLSRVLNELGLALGQRETETYRNATGVYMKLMNFRRLDPTFAAEGKAGLSRGNKDEELVWTRFADDIEGLSRVAALIRENLQAHADDSNLAGPDEPDIEEAEEGRVLTRVHRFRERDGRLVKAAKNAALRKFGRLFCVACEFDFCERYGVIGSGIIDVHHTKPVHSLRPGETTKVDDLALLCSNCHRLIHSRRPWLSIEEVRQALLVEPMPNRR